MGTTIENLQNLSDWAKTQEQSANGESATVSQKSNEAIETTLEIGGLHFTSTTDYLYDGGSKVKDPSGNNIELHILKCNKSYKTGMWLNDREKREKDAFESVYASINNWYEVQCFRYFKDNGYIMDEFTVGNKLPFGECDLSCEYTKTSGDYNDRFTYIPMPQYPQFIKNGHIINTNSSWGFGNCAEYHMLRWAWINNNDYFGVYCHKTYDGTEDMTYYDTPNQYSIMLIEKTEQLMNWLGTNYTVSGGFGSFDEQLGEASQTQGWSGIFDEMGDIISQSPTPKGVTDCGFYNVYVVDDNSLQRFGQSLFGDINLNFEGMTVTQWEHVMERSNSAFASIPEEERPQKAEWLANTFNASFGISDLFKLGREVASNLFSGMLTKYVVDCHIIPVAPTISGFKTPIKVGWKTTDSEGNLCSSDYVDISCGVVNIKPKFDSFLDLTETTVKLYLPFCGVVNISPQYVFNHNVEIRYRFNIITGDCIAYVLSDAVKGGLSVIGTYNGSCCVHLPITGEGYSQMLSGITSTVGGFEANSLLGLGNASNMFASALNGTVSSSNGYSATASYMGQRTPYFTIERPIPNLPPRYLSDHGAVSEIVAKPSQLHGFVKCRDVKLDNSVKYEIAVELKRIMEEGFFV